MKMIDRQFTETPFYGVRRMTAWLATKSEQVNQKRVRRLMRQMGLEAIYPKPNLSQPQAGASKYPYLLRGKVITAPNQVWSTDITCLGRFHGRGTRPERLRYISLPHGYLYLVAVIDWYSRYVLSWELSNTMDVQFCMSALEKALAQNTPEIFNSDQGSQFTSTIFTNRLAASG
jgi:putative transposase